MSELTGNTLKIHDRLGWSPSQLINRRTEFGKVLVDEQQHCKFLFLFLQSTNLIRNRTALYYFPFQPNLQTNLISRVLSVCSRPSPIHVQHGEPFTATYHQPFADCWRGREKNDPLRYWVPVGTKMNGRRESFHPECRGTTKRKLGKTNRLLR